ncbi:MAG: ATP-binding protein [Flavobacteriaceae bacterium]|nr:ATP-binding protein [Flavobacteriaceae bacterium]
MIRIEHLKKRYEDTTVLNIAEMDIPKGQVFGLVGNNGAGKTTLFSLLLDLIQATEGIVSIDQVDVSTSEDWKTNTAAFLDDSFLIGYLTPEEYFYFIGELRNVSKQEVDELLSGYADFFNDEILNKKKYIRDLSKGNQKKVGVVATFIGEPQLLILDEPFANLDPTTQIRLKELLTEKGKDPNTTILISSHDIQHVTEVCERIAVLEKGEIVKDLQTTAKTLKELEAFFTK